MEPPNSLASEQQGKPSWLICSLDLLVSAQTYVLSSSVWSPKSKQIERKAKYACATVKASLAANVKLSTKEYAVTLGQNAFM
jgi:hypothetical protein